MQEKVHNDADRTTMICIDSYDQGVPQGRFYNLGQEHAGSCFHGLVQLLTGMEEIFNASGFPQQFTQMRTFTSSTNASEDEWAKPMQGDGCLATFVVKIFFRQHTSWQGSITWLEQKVDKTFRSALELIFLMDSALGGCRKSSHRLPGGYALGGQEALESSLS